MNFVKQIHFITWKWQFDIGSVGDDISTIVDKKMFEFFSSKIFNQLVFFVCFRKQAQIQLAVTYYHSKLLRKYFSLLRSNVTNEQYEQVLEQQADTHYR